jgi:F-type H+-transporting ATPase subunit b
MVTNLVAQAKETPNFLVPNATIFVVFVIFLAILFFFYRFVVPPLTKALAEREEMNRKQVEDRENAQRKLAEAEERYEKALAEARGEAARIRDEARAEAQKIRDDMKADTDREVAAIHRRGAEQLATQREEAVRSLRAEIGGLSTQLAERVLGRSLPGDGSYRPTIDSFLADLDRDGDNAASGSAPASGASTEGTR